MAAYTLQPVGYTGVNVSFVNVAGVDTAQASSRGFLWIKNGSGVSTTVTISIPGETFLQANPDVSVSIPAGQERMMGPLNPEIISPAQGAILFVTSPATSITAAVVEIPIPSGDLP